MRQHPKTLSTFLILFVSLCAEIGTSATVVPPFPLSFVLQTDQHYNQALSYFEQQQYELARQEFQQALTGYRQAKNPVRVVRCLLGICLLYTSPSPRD